MVKRKSLRVEGNYSLYTGLGMLSVVLEQLGKANLLA